MIEGFKLTHYALKGTEVITFDDLREWAAYIQANPDCMIVKQDEIAGASLSTVLLPFPTFSSFSGDAPLFETMVFYGGAHRHAHMMARYPTYEAAYAAHIAIAGCLNVLEKERYEINEAALTAVWHGVFGANGDA